MWRCALNKTRRGCRAASTTATRGLGLHWAADGPAAARALPPPPAPRQRLPQFERPWDRPTCPTVTTRGLRTHPAAAAAAGTGRGADGDPRRPADEAGGEAAAGPTDGSGDAAKEPAAAAATGGGAERGDGGPCGAADEVGGDAAGGDQGRSGGGGGVGEDDDEDDPEALEQMMSQVVNAIWKIGIPPRGLVDGLKTWWFTNELRTKGGHLLGETFDDQDFVKSAEHALPMVAMANSALQAAAYLDGLNGRDTSWITDDGRRTEADDTGPLFELIGYEPDLEDRADHVQQSYAFLKGAMTPRMFDAVMKTVGESATLGEQREIQFIQSGVPTVSDSEMWRVYVKVPRDPPDAGPGEDAMYRVTVVCEVRFKATDTIMLRTASGFTHVKPIVGHKLLRFETIAVEYSSAEGFPLREDEFKQKRNEPDWKVSKMYI